MAAGWSMSEKAVHEISKTYLEATRSLITVKLSSLNSTMLNPSYIYSQTYGLLSDSMARRRGST
jgi:hypothetical protein